MVRDLRQGGQAPCLDAVPRQPEPTVAALDDHIVPIVVEELGGDPARRRMREGPEIADPAVDVKLAIGGDTQQTVKAVCPRVVVPLSVALRPSAAVVTSQRLGEKGANSI